MNEEGPNNSPSDLYRESNHLLSQFSSTLGLNSSFSLLFLNENNWDINEIEDFMKLGNSTEESICNDQTFCSQASPLESFRLNCSHFICKLCLISKLRISLESTEGCFNIKCIACDFSINEELFSCDSPREDFVLKFHQLLIASSTSPSKIIFYKALKDPPLMVIDKNNRSESGSLPHSLFNCDENERENLLNAQRQLKCDTHNNSQAIRLNLTEKSLHCEICKGQSGDFYLSLLSCLFTKYLKAKILCTFFADQRTITNNPPDISALSLQRLIQLYKNLNRDLICSPICMLSSRCTICQKLFEISNKPYISSLLLICESCIPFYSGPRITLKDSTVISNPSAIPFISIINSIPCCSRCNLPYNLKDRYPREFSCGHLICLSCLKSKHQLTGKENCYTCSGPESIYNLASNVFLIHCIRRTLIYCSRHKGQAASHLEEVSLKSFCSKCLMFSQGNKLDLSVPNLRIFNFLYETFVHRRQNDAMSIETFESLSFQEMIDEIRALRDPLVRDSLNSSIPKGRILDDWLNDCGTNCFLIRFLTVMPSSERNPNYALVTKAWVISIDQVEAVSISADRQILLTGIIFGQRQSIGRAFIDKVKFIKGNLLTIDGDDLIESRVEISGAGLSQRVMLRPVPMLSGEKYSLVISVTGDDVTLVRGNPFDIKEELLGSDGTKFEFSEPEDPGDYKINGQHDISGPILGLIYK